MKPTLLLLHGALGSKEQLAPLERLLKTDFQTYSLNFSGHGGRPMPEKALSIDLFASDVIQWMDEQGIKKIDIFGYSMGGYVALFIARHFPDRIGRIFTLATKLEWSESIAEKEIKMLNPDKIQEKIPAFAELLKLRHAPNDWKELMKRSAEMMIAMGKNNPLKEKDYLLIPHKVLLTVGDNDNTVTRDETSEVARMLKNSQLEILEDTEHPLEKVDAYNLASELKLFFN